jgi:hypothetical protein
MMRRVNQMTQLTKLFRAKSIVGLLLVGLAVWLAGCSTSTSTATAGPGDIDMTKLTLAPASVLPDYVQDAPPRVQEAYRFALANPHVLEKIPCYCGCNAQGHMNNLDCYVVPNTGGEFEPHAAY